MWEFMLIKLEESLPPGKGPGDRWYCYTIANRITEITGTRRGSREEVLSFVNNSLQRLNSRHKATSFSKR